MKSKKWFVFLMVLIVSLIFGGASRGKPAVDFKKAPPVKTNNLTSVCPDFGSVPLYFIPNKGQVDKKALFYVRAAGYTLWLTKGGLVFDSAKASGGGSRLAPTHTAGRNVSRLFFLGANQNPQVTAVEQAGYRVNYFAGNDKSRWQADIPTSKAVLYKDIYQNIDVKVYGIEKQIEYDWIVKPGANPENIEFAYSNVESTRIDSQGSLIVTTKLGRLKHKRPVSYQVIQTGAGKPVKQEINVVFKKIAENTYGFSVEKYDRSRELVIDPLVQLEYSTYLGGKKGGDVGSGIAVDGEGCAYVAGYTGSQHFPILDPIQGERNNSPDAFISKFSADGSSLLYSTYLGGSGRDYGQDIAVDMDGCAYVTGVTTSKDFPLKNEFQKEFNNGLATAGKTINDGFIVKLSAEGNALVYSTYLGGSGYEYGRGIAVDGSGCAYVTGLTKSTDFPLKNSLQPEPGGGDDAFVTKLTPEGSALIYSTYLGGGGDDGGSSVAIDSEGCAYITGDTSRVGFPTKNAFQGTWSGKDDAFVSKISADGAALIYSTYLGGRWWESSYSIAVDNSGHAYVTGSTYSDDFPTKNPVQGTYKALRDAFVSKLSPAGDKLVYSTYLGGGKSDVGTGIAVDSKGHAYVTGYTYSINFPTNNAYQKNRAGWAKYTDAFVSKLSPSGDKLLFSTYFGGTSSDYGWDIALGPGGCAYVTGDSGSDDFPVKNAFQSNSHSSGNAFVAKLTDNPPPVVSITAPDDGEIVSGRVTIRVKATDNTGIDRLDFFVDNEFIGSDNQAPYSFDWDSYYVSNGGHTIKVEAVDAGGHKASAKVTVSTRNVMLTVTESRREERAWLVTRDFGEISLSVHNPWQLVVAKYIIYRNEAGGEYLGIKEIPGSDVQGGSYIFNDTNLEKDKTYSYKAEALTESGEIIGISGADVADPVRRMKKKKFVKAF